MCTTCHATDVITDAPRTVPSWVDTILSMKDFGATGSEEDWKAVTDYILVNLAHLDVNKSTAAEMAPVLRVSEKVAEGVVDGGCSEVIRLARRAYLWDRGVRD